MTGLTAALCDLARLLDGLAILAWIPALAALAATLRVFWLEWTTPHPEVSRWLIPVAVPANLARDPEASYGPRTRRAAFPGAMTRATLLSASLLPALLLLALALAGIAARNAAFTRPGGGNQWHTEIKNVETDPTVTEQYGNGGRPAPRPPDIRYSLIIPTRNHTAPAESLQTLTDLDLAVPYAPGPDIGIWDARGTGPAGPDGQNGPGFNLPGPEAEDPPIDLAVVDEMPVLVSLPAPRYPEMARQASIEGRVTLGLLVGSTGRVEKTRLLESIPALDEAALAAARDARFKPATWRGRTVRVWVTMPVRFSLKETP